MEGTSLAFTTISSPPSTFLHRWPAIVKQSHTNPIGTPITSDIRKDKFSVKAVNSRTQTLSSNWNVSTSPSWLPGFEHLDTTNMLLRQRTVFLGNELDDVTADFIIAQLLLLDSEDSKTDIRLFINSPGGSTTAGFGIYDAMKLCKADVSTICMGYAASVAAFILSSGTRGKRFCMPNSRVMIHRPEVAFAERFAEMNIATRELNYSNSKLMKILSRITGKPEEKIKADSEFDYFMNAWEAKEYGLVDAVIDDGKPGLVAPASDYTPPPRSRTLHLWEYDGMEILKNLPSEERWLQNGSASGQRNDAERDGEKEEEAPEPK